MCQPQQQIVYDNKFSVDKFPLQDELHDNIIYSRVSTASNAATDQLANATKRNKIAAVRILNYKRIL